MKIGYKGTDKDMMCMKAQYEIGKTYYVGLDNKITELPENATIVLPKTTIQLCSNKAIHYCDTLDNVFSYYSNNGKNRFFKIEIIGDFIDDKDKSGARIIRFIEEVPQEELKEIQRLKDEALLDSRMHLKELVKLQALNPFLVVGGSIGLYLHGVRLKRFHGTEPIDYDFCLPFFQLLQGCIDLKVENTIFEKGNGYDTDFERAVTINGVKADLRIDPKQRYEIVEYKGFAHKVTPLETIIRAKANYAHTKWGEKHKDDLIEMILKK